MLFRAKILADIIQFIALQALNYIDNGILPDLKNQAVIQALTNAGYFSTEEAKQ